jgi:predicted acyl esterase
VQNTAGDWTVYQGAWPPLGGEKAQLNLTQGGLSWSEASSGTVSWVADPLALVLESDEYQVVLESDVLEETLFASGVPLLEMTITSTSEKVHLAAVLQYQEPGSASWSRMNWGLLDPVYRSGVDDPRVFVAGERLPVTIDFHPQEDVFEAGGKLRLVLSSIDTYSVPLFEPGTVTVHLGDEEHPARLLLPLSP